ncbi:MAG: transcriptional repressor [Atopobiaceae bacterium]|nr:transcriptional repressor [Atopobiaceae bacterium]
MAGKAQETPGSKAQYNTKHRNELFAYFQQRGSGHFTVADVCAYFREQGTSIGTATVYRQLEHMVDEGIVNKYIIDSNSPACFEYLGREEHCHEDVCFHCKCEACGKLIHLHCHELMAIQEHLWEHHSFKLTPTRTVFYGLCEECARKEGAA